MNEKGVVFDQGADEDQQILQFHPLGSLFRPQNKASIQVETDMSRDIAQAAKCNSVKFWNQWHKSQIPIGCCPPPRMLEAIELGIFTRELIWYRLNSRRDNDMAGAVRRIVDYAVL
jgi:hypothetical protein